MYLQQTSERTLHVRDYACKDSLQLQNTRQKNGLMKSIDICDIPPNYLEMVCTLYSNSTATQEMPTRVCDELAVMFSSKSFDHWLTSEGIDAMKVKKADSNMK